jgi:hypothetical protein
MKKIIKHSLIFVYEMQQEQEHKEEQEQEPVLTRNLKNEIKEEQEQEHKEEQEQEHKEKIRWYNPMKRQIEKEIDQEIANGGLSEKTIRQCQFIEQIKAILSGKFLLDDAVLNANDNEKEEEQAE